MPLLGASQVDAAAITTGVYCEFHFSGSGPALENYAFCDPTNPGSTDAGDAPWTISLTGPAVLTVLDVFLSTDRFEIFNNLVSIGTTSVNTAGSSCGGDIACALADPSFSRATWRPATTA